MTPGQIAQCSAAIRPVLDARVALGTLTDVPASLRELPRSRAQQQYGLDDVRLADCLMLHADLYGTDLVRDLVITVAAGQQAGPWYLLEVLATDDVSVNVRLRRSTRHSSATPGATTIR